MALAVDTTTATRVLTNSAAIASNAHTCTGPNPVLFACFSIRSTNTLTATPTYNGATMTQLATTTGNTNMRHYIYYLINPTTGASHTVQATQSGSLLAFAIATISFSDANQTTQPDASALQGNVTTTSFSTSVTTVANGAWPIFWGNATSGAALTAGADTTVINQPEVAFAGCFLLRRTTAQATAGVSTLAVTSSSQNFSGIIASVNPVASAPVANNGFMAWW
jgi:hypothetical protein